MVKLADLGDALTATPALRALRQTWSKATIDVLTTPIGASALEGLDSVDHLWVADKHRFDSPAGALALPALTPLLAGLRRRHYDQLLLLHHLTTRFGTAKYALLAAAINATRTVGLDNGRGNFLDVRVPDTGFGAHHEVDYAVAVATAAGATPPTAPRLEIALDPATVHRAAELLRAGGSIAAAEAGRDQFANSEPTFDQPANVDSSPDRVARAGAASEAQASAVGRPRASLAGTPASLLPHPREALPWIALHAGGGAYSTARRWPAESFLAAGQAIAKQAHIVLVGTETDREPHDHLARELGALDLTGRTSVKETAAVLARCRLLVSNDSGVVHLAAAVGTPVVAVFGPSNDLAWGPYPASEHRVVRASLPCSPCFYRGTSLGTPEGCPTRDCLQLVTPDMVVEAAISLLAQPAAA